VAVEPPRKGEDAGACAACKTPDEAYIWVSERWRVRAMDQPSGLPMVLILESRSHLDLGDLPNLLAAELGVMTVRLERAVRSLDGVARVHVNRWGDGSAHLHIWFLARPYGRLQLRGTFLSLWDDILPPISEAQWRENLALVAAWLAEFGGRPLAEPPRFQWQTPLTLSDPIVPVTTVATEPDEGEGSSVAMAEAPPEGPSQGPSQDAPADPAQPPPSSEDPTRVVVNADAHRSDASYDHASGSASAEQDRAETEPPATDRDPPARTATV
jgi:diadenosine tetraphosphate (Ap4A) HIT family hydrolase